MQCENQTVGLYYVLRHNFCNFIMHYAKKNMFFIFKLSGDNLTWYPAVLFLKYLMTVFPQLICITTLMYLQAAIISFSHVSLLFFRLFLIGKEFHCSSHHFCSSAFLVLYFRSEKRTMQWGWKTKIVLHTFFTPSLILNIVSVQVLVGCWRFFLATKVMFS